MQHTEQISVIASAKQFLEHWQGHRRPTRRVIDAFPENELFRHSIGDMRPPYFWER